MHECDACPDHECDLLVIGGRPGRTRRCYQRGIRRAARHRPGALARRGRPGEHEQPHRELPRLPDRPHRPASWQGLGSRPLRFGAEIHTGSEVIDLRCEGDHHRAMCCQRQDVHLPHDPGHGRGHLSALGRSGCRLADRARRLLRRFPDARSVNMQASASSSSAARTALARPRCSSRSTGRVSTSDALPAREVDVAYLIDRIVKLGDIREHRGRVAAVHGTKSHGLDHVTVADPDAGDRTRPQGCSSSSARSPARTGHRRSRRIGAVHPDRPGHGTRLEGRGRGGVSPFYLETSVPGIFAAGDIRSDSVKRVSAAAGEGAMAVQFIHKYLELEPLERFIAAVGRGHIRGPYSDGVHYVEYSGANARHVMRVLWPYLSTPKKCQYLRALNHRPQIPSRQGGVKCRVIP
jgi:hypothetical protein